MSAQVPAGSIRTAEGWTPLVRPLYVQDKRWDVIVQQMYEDVWLQLIREARQRDQKCVELELGDESSDEAQRMQAAALRLFAGTEFPHCPVVVAGNSHTPSRVVMRVSV